MSRFTLPRDIYYGANALENLKNLKGSRAVLVLGGGSMKKFGFVDKALGYLKEAGIETRLIENVEPDPSVETVMSGAAVMREFEPDWIISMGGGSPIDAAKAMWAFYEYPETTFEVGIVKTIDWYLANEEWMNNVTSGNYQRFYEVDGERYNHIIDPDTLMPADHFSAVAVLVPDSGLGDCLSTGLFCLPLEDGQALVESLDGVEAMWMLKDGSVVYSSGFGDSVKATLEGYEP